MMLEQMNIHTGKKHQRISTSASMHMQKCTWNGPYAKTEKTQSPTFLKSEILEQKLHVPICTWTVLSLEKRKRQRLFVYKSCYLIDSLSISPVTQLWAVHSWNKNISLKKSGEIREMESKHAHSSLRMLIGTVFWRAIRQNLTSLYLFSRKSPPPPRTHTQRRMYKSVCCRFIWKSENLETP